MVEHTPTPICYELTLPTGTATTYNIFHAKNSVGAVVSGDAAEDPYGDEEKEVIAFVGDVWGDHAKEWAALITASVNAFHPPDGRTIATEQINEGLFWRMHEIIEDLIADQTSSYCEWCESHAEKDDDGNLIGRVRHRIGCPAKDASDFLSSLKIEEPTDG